MKVKNVRSRAAELKEMSAPCSWSNCKATITRFVVSYVYRRSVSTYEHAAEEDGRPRTPEDAQRRPARTTEAATRTMHLCTEHRASFGKKYKV